MKTHYFILTILFANL